ncbi:MAG: zf-TFIIB domain-containing protein [Burkholderiales bacterium]|nr:zf-TFIIB domain-containing protein [Burkholderiales bacterium]
MKCPSCPETTLVMAERQGVEGDYCPSCRGIWLTEGSLTNFLERAVFASAPAPRQCRKVASNPTLKTLTSVAGSATNRAARSHG